MELDDNMKDLMKQLGAAINESLSSSEIVSDAFDNIREAGFEVFLILEATVGLHRREQEEGVPQDFSILPSGELMLSAQDAQFLKSLKIRVGGNEESSSSN